MLRRIFPAILLSLVNVLGFSIMIPILPSIVEEFSGSANGLIYGVLLSLYSICQFLFTPFLGRMSDHFGRRKILMLSQTGTLLSWVIFCLAGLVDPSVTLGPISIGLVVIGFSRIVDGITGGNNAVAYAWVSDRVSKEERTRAFGLMGAMVGVGFLVGPLLGGLSYATPYGLVGTGLLSILISVVTLYGLWRHLPETVDLEKGKDAPLNFWEGLNLFAGFRTLNPNPATRQVLRFHVLFSLVFVGFTTTITLLFDQFYDFTPIGIGMMMVLIGVFFFINQVFLINALSKRLGERDTYFLGIYLLTLGLISLFGIVYSLGPIIDRLVFGLLTASIFLSTLGISILLTTFKSLLTHSVDESKQGLATGIDESIAAFGRATVPAAAGFLYDIVSFGVFMLFGALLLIPVLIRKRHL